MSRRARRRRAKRIRNTVTILAALFLLLIGIFAVSTKTANADAITNTRFKYYTSITVEEGDTLWSIAEEYKTEEYASIKAYIKEVKQINHISGTEIYSGSALVVPYYSDEYKL